MATKGGKQKAARHSTDAGFAGDNRNMRGRTKVPCRILNDFAGDDKADTSTYQRGPRAGEFRRVPVMLGLTAMDFTAPEQSGRFLPDAPGRPQTPERIADSWRRLGA